MVIGVTISMLGTGYGYWSDEKVIEAKIKTPKVVLGFGEGTFHKTAYASDVIEICKGDTFQGELLHEKQESCEDKIILTLDVETESGEESSIPLKYEDCEVYFIEDINAPVEEEGILLKDLNPVVYTAKETSEGSRQIEIEISTLALKSLISAESESYKTNKARLKVKLNFRQEIVEDEEAWFYPVEKEYEIRFIEPIAKVEAELPKLPAGDNTLPQGNSTPEGGNLPQGNSAPESSSLPQESSAPEGSGLPQESSAPGGGSLPQESSAPETGSLPQESSVPVSSSLPQESSSSESSSLLQENSTPASDSLPQENSSTEDGGII